MLPYSVFAQRAIAHIASSVAILSLPRMNVPKLQIKLFLGTQSGLPVDRLFSKKLSVQNRLN